MIEWIDLIGSVVLAQVETGAPEALADAANAAGAAEESASLSVWQFIVKGGVMMIPIGLCSLLAFAVVIERCISTRRRKVIPESFLPGLKKVLAANPDEPARAIAYCRKNDSPVARVFAAGIRRMGGPLEIVERHIQEAGQREVFELRKYLRVVSVIATVTPLMGLLGTIFGMIMAFQTVANSADALGKTEMLADGIYQAMITTAAGLVVAIPALICYHWLTARVTNKVMEIDHMTVDFVADLFAGDTEVLTGDRAESASASSMTPPPLPTSLDGVDVGVATS